jgi:hypothetical protein
MNNGRLRYTKFGAVNALLSLIPIFPTWTLFPGVLIGKVLGSVFRDCELGYILTFLVSFVAATGLVVRYLRTCDFSGRGKTTKQVKMNFRLFSLAIYTILNTGILIIVVGSNLMCRGDGQTLLACIYSGPLASIGILILGFIIDLKINSSDNDAQ